MTVATAPRGASGSDPAVPVSASAMVRETIAVAATLCGTVSALLPLFERGMANTHDGLIHVQRLIALESAIRQGAPFMRWLPDLAYGYGQPLLLYYAPLAYLPALLAGTGPVTSIEIASGLALVLSALAMYVLARSLFGALAAVVAAIVYAVLPYQLVDVYVRGALAESWAFVWLPWCAWCLTRAWTDGRARWSVGLAVAVAGLVLTHNVMALLFLPALIALGIVLQLCAGPDERGAWSQWRDVPIRPLAGLALGLVLSAWFWLPALAERHLVQVGETIEPELFASFFVRGWPPFRLDPLYDYQLPVSTALGTPIYWPQLGLIQVCVTVVGAVAAVRIRGAVRAVAVWAVLLALGGFLMQLRPLAPLYDVVPLLQFVQFPWRLLALVGLGSAILAGVLVETLSARAAIRWVFATTIVGLSLVTALAQLNPEPMAVDERMLSIESITRLELADYGLGTTHSGEYLPVSSGQRNAARFRKTIIEAGGGQGGSSTAPSGLQIEQIDWRPDRLRAVVTAPVPERLILHQFAFPGWAAWVDGAQVAVETAGQLGLVSVQVPAGRHSVEIAWGWTRLRLWAAVGSLVGLLMLVGLAGWKPSRTILHGRLVAVMAVGIGAALLAPAGRPAVTAAAQVPETVRAHDVSDALTLVDVRHDTSRMAVDRVVQSRLIWQVRQTPSTGFRAFVEVVTPDGTVHHRAPWIYEPLSRLWEPGELVATTVAIRVPGDIPGGGYQLRLAFDRPEGVVPVVLATFSFPSPRDAPLAVPEDTVQVGMDVRLWETGAPAGAGGRPIVARPGSSIDLPLRWQQLGMTPNVDREMMAVAVLIATRGEVVSEPRRPGDWFAPLPFWQRGDLIEQNIRMSLPGWLPEGSYPLLVRVFPRDLARSGISEPGAASARPRGRPVAELPLGTVTVEP